MKNPILFLLLLGLSLLAACGSNQPRESTPGESTPASPPMPELMVVPAELKQVVVDTVSQASVDAVNDTGMIKSSPQERVFRAKSNAPLSLRGWAYDEIRKSVPPVVWVELTLKQSGQRFYIPTTRHARPDVIEGFKVPWATMCGFATPDVRDHNLPRGTYDVRVYQIDKGTAVGSKFSGTESITLVVE